MRSVENGTAPLPSLRPAASAGCCRKGCCARADLDALLAEIRGWEARGLWAVRGAPASAHAAERTRHLVRSFTRSQEALGRAAAPVVGTYACPMQIGNRLHEFLNAFAVAAVAGRPLHWRFFRAPFYPIRPERCEAVLHRRNWTAAARATPFDYGLHHLDAPRRLACAASDLAAAPFAITPGQLEWHQGAALAAAELPARAARRAATLFALGADFAYGTMLRAAFSFDEAPQQQPRHNNNNRQHDARAAHVDLRVAYEPTTSQRPRRRIDGADAARPRRRA